MEYKSKIVIEKRKIMYYEGFQYLLEKGRDKGITPKDIRDHLKDRERRKPTSINGKGGLFYKMLEHAINRNGDLMKNVIGDFDKLNETLFNFDPKKVFQKYESNEESGRKLFDDIVINLKLENINDGNRGTWVIFSKSIVSIAEFLSTFNTIDEFNNYVDGFNENEDKRIKLALILDKIYGYGFALACDFLKENCDPKYVKPDRHIKNLFTEDIVDELSLEIKNQTKNKDIEIFRVLLEYSNSISKQPYKVDKLFFLIGSGHFYRDGVKIDTSIDEFKIRIKEIFDSKYQE